MTENTDYSMSPADAELIAALCKHDLGARRSMTKAVAEQFGVERLVELLAQFIGMANSVAANCGAMSDMVLIEECGVHPDKFDSVNLPTILGACQGVLLAGKCDPAGACYSCAYRLGSPANQSPIATSDAEFKSGEPRGFMCHAHLDERGEPTKVCVGHAKANKQQD